MSKKSQAKYSAIVPGIQQEAQWEPPPKTTLKTFCYNPKTGTVFSRTPLSWAKLIVFYSVLFAFIAAFFAIQMHWFMTTISPVRPKYILEESIIGANPGLGFLPFPEDIDDGVSIILTTSNKSVADVYVERMNRNLDGYFDSKKLPNKGKNQMICGFDQLPKPGKACAIPIENWSPCTKEEGYSYYRNSPCVVLKLNRIYGWIPRVYNDTDDLPEEMPQDLTDHIKKLSPKERNQIWVDCRGVHPVDRENIGPISYVSRRGFPAYYFPYLNVPDYLSPLVAIRLERPRTNTLISVECRAWAKNIVYRGGTRDRTGSVMFEIMID